VDIWATVPTRLIIVKIIMILRLVATAFDSCQMSNIVTLLLSLEAMENSTVKSNYSPENTWILSLISVISSDTFITECLYSNYMEQSFYWKADSCTSQHFPEFERSSPDCPISPPDHRTHRTK
jgi:hypothetical protein